jgi:hypothetical protein
MTTNRLVLRTDRPGFALPMSILVIGFLTAAVMAAFARTGTEVRIVDNQQAQQQAFAFANAGLEDYLSRGRVGATNTTINFDGGVAHVRLDTIRIGATAVDTAVFMIRSRGVSTTGPTSGRPRATRTVAQFAMRPPMTMQVLSSWTSISGLRKNGSSGIISGHDAGTCSGGTVLPGVAVPDNTYVQTGAGTPIKGEPPVQEMGTQEEMADKINIDWENIRHPTAPSIVPDIVVCKAGTYSYDAARGPCGTFPTKSTFTNNPDYWPVIVINGSSPLPEDGRGFLIVTGDLTFGGGDKWDGIILVGGKITDNGAGNIAGAVVTGLNVLLGETVAESSQAEGTKDYTYDSCKVAAAAAGAGRLHAIPNAWTDSWLTW